jgi:hypothetical protein
MAAVALPNAAAPVIRAPIVILGAPRSGTTMLYDALARSADLYSLGGESHAILEGPFAPARCGWHGNAVGAREAAAAPLAALREAFARAARTPAGAAAAPGEPIRLLEKTPKNCLRIPLLRALFPDAHYVFLRRDGRATLASLLAGWRAGGRYESYTLPEPLRIPGHAGARWCFLLPPGWRALRDRPLAEVCAAQWSAAVEAVLEAAPALRAEGRFHEVAYEALVRDPRRVLEALCERLALPFEERLLDAAGGLRQVNTVRAPRDDKWREASTELAPVLPRIAELQARLGYPTGLG